MKILLTIVALYIASSLGAQVKFQDITLQEAINKAAASGKIVFVQFESETCRKCNEVADISMASTEVGRVVNEKSIPVKIAITSSDRQQFVELYNTKLVYGTFFLTWDGELLHVYPTTTTRASEYINQVNMAYNKIIEGQASLKELDEEWKNSPANFAAMEKNLQRRSSLYLPADSMLDVYVKRLPPDSATSPRIMRFILLMRPALFSEANSYLQKNGDLVRQVWTTCPKALQVRLTAIIRNKSIRKAIAQKNINMALRTAAFSSTTFLGKSLPAGSIGFEKYMLDFFVGIKDTTNYLKKAENFFDRFLMKESVDETKRQDSIMLQKLSAAADKDTVWDDNYTGKYTIKSARPYATKAAFFSNELHRGARLVYSSTSDQRFLAKALQWSGRALQFYQTPYALDIHARLLYKLGNREQAIAWEEKAVEQSQKGKYIDKMYEQVLAKMQAGEAEVDSY